MSLTGGKRKANKSLKAWVTFVKKVQREEKLSYKDAIHRAKIRKDKGEKWMTGGGEDESTISSLTRANTTGSMATVLLDKPISTLTNTEDEVVLQGSVVGEDLSNAPYGGKRRRRTMRRSRGRGRGRTARRARRHASRRHASRRH